VGVGVNEGVKTHVGGVNEGAKIYVRGVNFLES